MTTSVPRRKPLSMRTASRPPTAAAIAAAPRWGDAVIELPTAVIADHDAVETQRGGALGVGHGQHALDEELAAPVLADPADVVPGDGRLEQPRKDRAPAHGVSPAGRKLSTLRKRGMPWRSSTRHIHRG